MGIFGDKYVNTMGADALTPYVAKSPATQILPMQDKQAIAFN